MNHQYCAESNTIRIRPLKRQDIEYLRQWRNDPELSRYLSPIPYISPESQQEWFDRYLADDDILFFSIIVKERDAVVGSVAVYGMHEGQCEVGRIVIGDSSVHGKGIGYGSLLMAMAIAVNRLDIRTVRLDVHEDNAPARRIYEKAGFHIVGSHPFAKGGLELEMEISATEFYQMNQLTQEIHIGEEA